MKEIEWSEESLDDMADLDQGIARRIKTAVERFAETGAGNVRPTWDVRTRVVQPVGRLARRGVQLQIVYC